MGLDAGVVSDIITIKTKNAYLTELDVCIRMMSKLESRPDCYNKEREDGVYRLHGIGKFLASCIEEEKGSRDEELWTRLTEFGPQVLEAIEAVGRYQVPNTLLATNIVPTVRWGYAAGTVLWGGNDTGRSAEEVGRRIFRQMFPL